MAELDYAQITAYAGDTLYWLGIMFWTILGIAVMAFFWYWITFNVPTHIYEKVGKNNVLRFLRRTRVKINTKENVTKMKIFGIREDYPPPMDEDFMLGRKGKLLNLMKEGNKFTPFQMSSNPGTISLQDTDIRFWAAQAMRDENRKYNEPSFMQKYGAYMMFVFGLLVLGWMYYIMITTVGADIDRNLAIADKVAEAMRNSAAGP